MGEWRIKGGRNRVRTGKWVQGKYLKWPNKRGSKDKVKKMRGEWGPKGVEGDYIGLKLY